MTIPLNERMKKVRTAAGFTQGQLAKMLDIGHPAYNMYEKGHRIPAADTLCRMAIITKANAGWLLTGIDTEMLEVYNIEEKEFCEKLLRIMRTKQEKTVTAIKQNLDAFLDNPDREKTPVPKKAASNEK